VLGSDATECTAGHDHQRLNDGTAYPGEVRPRARVEGPERHSPRDTCATPALIVLLVLAYGADLFATTAAIRASEVTHSRLPLPLITTLGRTPLVRTHGR
jgi:hypothetical protein